MESLLDYLLTALFAHKVTNVYSHNGSGRDALTGKSWTIELADRVCFTLDDADLKVIRSLYERRIDWLDDVDRARYMKLFDACI